MLPVGLWEESADSIAMWKRRLVAVIRKAEQDPSWIDRHFRVLGWDRKWKSVEEADWAAGDRVVRVGDIIDSGSGHWVLYVGDGMFLHLIARTHTLAGFVDYLLSGTTPAYVVVQRLHERPRRAVRLNPAPIPAGAADLTAARRLERLRRGVRLIGPASWDAMRMNCQHIMHYVAEGKWSSPWAPAVPAFWLGVMGLAGGVAGASPRFGRALQQWFLTHRSFSFADRPGDVRGRQDPLLGRRLRESTPLIAAYQALWARWVAGK